MGCSSSKQAHSANGSAATAVAKTNQPSKHQQHQQHQQQQKQQQQQQQQQQPLQQPPPQRSANGSGGDWIGASASTEDVLRSKIRADQPERLYKLLAKAATVVQGNEKQQQQQQQQRYALYQKVLEHCREQPMAAKWQNPNTGSTPLHMACRLMDVDTSQDLSHVVAALLAIHAAALRTVDAAQHIPLHYAIAPTTHFSPYGGVGGGGGDEDHDTGTLSRRATATATAAAPPLEHWKERALLVQQLVSADPQGAAQYLEENDVVFESGDATGGCTPLYRILQTLPDDLDPAAPTVEYVSTVLQAASPVTATATATASRLAGRGNASDGDKPLSLLYRRFTRQFDLSEQFFPGDNSRPEVVTHRQRYKTAAGNTWKLMEVLLRPANLPTPTTPWGIVHQAVQVETPPDLLRYIVETNAQDLTRVDPQGNLPLHYAAAALPPSPPSRNMRNSTTTTTTSSTSHTNAGGGNSFDHFPAFYTKYVMDELLYKFPEAAGMTDAEGCFPLTLAVQSGKQWIGGGIKSLYDAYPDALQQINLKEHTTLARVLSMIDEDNDNDNNGDGDDDDDDDQDINGNNVNEKQDSKDDQQLLEAATGVVKDEHHDAIMLVQQPNVTVEEVATSMWAHEEDAGVQMLGCVAISNMSTGKAPVDVLRIALSATAAVVNAMKAHPNEVIVQEKACQALQGLAVADGQREVSMVASGAVAAVVGAMQAHVGDAGVQEQACQAVAAIVRKGGADRATVVASVSGVTAILNALAAHAHIVGVQLAGLYALRAMTEHPNANLPDLPRAQTEPLLMAAQKAFPAECADLAAEVLQRMPPT